MVTVDAPIGVSTVIMLHCTRYQDTAPITLRSGRTAAATVAQAELAQTP